MIEFLGYMAAACTTISFIPQAIQIYKTKHTKDISLGMFVIFFAGLIFWLAYGIMVNSLPVILANSLTMIFAGYILVQKIKHG